MTRPHRMADVMAELLLARGYGRLTARAAFDEAWAQAAGARVAERSRAGALRRGVLEVTVAHSTLAQELGFQKQELLARLRASLPDQTIRDVRFRVGTLD